MQKLLHQKLDGNLASELRYYLVLLFIEFDSSVDARHNRPINVMFLTSL